MLPANVKLIIQGPPFPVYVFQQRKPRHNHATMQEQCENCIGSDATSARLYCQL